MNSFQTTSFARRHLRPRSLAIVLAFVFGLTLSANVHATPRIKHIITKQHNVAPSMGRELYFALPQNYDDQPGKYFYLYVTSPKQTTIHVQTSLVTLVQSVAPYKVAAFNIPVGWEIKTNDVVEDKGVRVWSTDADVTGYLMSHNPQTSDGMYIFPTIGWGTDYVVAAYAGLVGGNDYPAEYVIVANQNNTLVEMTPSCGLRSGGNANTIAHPAGQKFSVILNKGQAIQYKAVGNDAEADVTGTIVHSNVPVGVIGASQCPDIPNGYPYCDHVLDMMPPTRTWAKTYYTAPSFNRLVGDTFLVIGSVPGQIIRRQGANSGDRRECVINQQYGTYWNNNVDEGSKWYSDQPFFLTQYLNSSTWDCQNCGFGDPAEVVVNPVEQYSKTVVFQTPTSQGSQSPYINYVNLIVKREAAATTTFDGKTLPGSGMTKITVDGIYDIYRAANIKPGTHIVVSDSGAGVYIYGYGSYESYAWTGSFGTGTYGSPDTVAPQAYTSGDCFDAHVELSDTEALATRINQIRLDSSYNMAYLLDANYAEGTAMPTSFYDMFVLDSTKEAFEQVSTFDLAGNETTVKSIYTPQVAIDSPGVISFGTGIIGGSAVEQYLYITNIGTVPFNIGYLKLLRGDQGFALDSSVTTPLAVGEVRRIRIGFIPVKSSTATDTVLFGDECIQQKVLLIGSGGAPDFAVTDDHWGQVLQGSTTQNTQVNIINLSSTAPIAITAISTDNPDFKFTGVLPFTLAPKEQKPLPFTFTGNTLGFNFGHGTFVSDIAGSKNDSLDGTVVSPSQSFHDDTTITVDCAQPGDTVHLSFYVVAEGTGVAKSTISSWSHTANTNPNFVNFHAEYLNQPIIAPATLSPNEKLWLYEDYVVPTNSTGTASDQITAFDADGKPIRTVTATISTTYRTQNTLDATLDYGVSDFRGAVTTLTTRLVNTAQDDLMVSDVSLVPGGINNASFKVLSSIIKRGAVTTTVTIPTTLEYLDTLITTVAFDPSVSLDQFQGAQLAYITNGCNNADPIPMMAQVVVHGASGAGYTAPVIAACSNRADDITVFNDKPLGVIDTIVDFQIVGADAARYSAPNQLGVTFDSGAHSIPVTFTPNGVGASNATVLIELRSNHGTDTVISIPISNVAATPAATAISAFATTDQVATTGSVITLPIDFTLNKSGITAPIQDLKIDGVRFTYNFNQDLLSISGAIPGNTAATQAAIVSAVTNLPSGWTVDGANSSINGNTMVLTLTNSKYLDETVTNFGNISFQVTLPKTDTMRSVQLVSMDLLQGGTPIQGCVTTAVQSGDFILSYSCGEKTLQEVMNGNNAFASFVSPITPNPATGGFVKLTYAVRGASPVSISIFDVLGNEVGRVVDNVQHEAGLFEAHFNTANLPSGTYTARMVVRGVATSKQFVVTK